MHSMPGGRPARIWIALSIGNSHWRWGYFEGGRLMQFWKTEPGRWEMTEEADWWQWCQRSPALAWHQEQNNVPFPPIYLVSVVERTRERWLCYPQIYPLTLSDIPMAGLYQGLGLDRALALWGAGKSYGWPVLVIDGGTALTFSGADKTGFQGGAIAPGIGLQLQMLHQKTAALPPVTPTTQLPPRWAINTHSAILSGVLWGTLASVQGRIEDWQQRYPHSGVIFTGGDGPLLLELLKQRLLQLMPKSERNCYLCDPHLIFKGIAQVQQDI